MSLVGCFVIILMTMCSCSRQSIDGRFVFTETRIWDEGPEKDFLSPENLEAHSSEILSYMVHSHTISVVMSVEHDFFQGLVLDFKLRPGEGLFEEGLVELEIPFVDGDKNKRFLEMSYEGDYEVFVGSTNNELTLSAYYLHDEKLMFLYFFEP